ncbi:Hypothetical predicted protein [Paramuricea clavata]|uniref:Uncharacterized protein n=1 Tax=Paramuricea clavata TaxID=317549 RepID=A0A6S7FNY9_PARCT|nr:Hypothetical predicted protein [Paramuricea clavata]
MADENENTDTAHLRQIVREEIARSSDKQPKPCKAKYPQPGQIDFSWNFAALKNLWELGKLYCQLNVSQKVIEEGSDNDDLESYSFLSNSSSDVKIGSRQEVQSSAGDQTSGTQMSTIGTQSSTSGTPPTEQRNVKVL